jgi:hypothetical protein
MLIYILVDVSGVKSNRCRGPFSLTAYSLGATNDTAKRPHTPVIIWGGGCLGRRFPVMPPSYRSGDPVRLLSGQRYNPWMWIRLWNENWQGHPKYLEETHRGVTLSTTNPAWPDLGLNPPYSHDTASRCLASWLARRIRNSWYLRPQVLHDYQRRHINWNNIFVHLATREELRLEIWTKNEFLSDIIIRVK